MKRILPSLILPGIIFLSTIKTEQKYYTLTDNSIFRISGTSSLHNWEMSSTAATGEAIINVSENSIRVVEILKVKVPAKSLKSGIHAMDNIAYNSLKADRHPRIEFSLQKINRIDKEKNSTIIDATGSLSIAGEKKMIDLKATGEIQNEEICFEGGLSMKMTEFGIKPPTALFGTLKTGDRISVYFKVIFKPEKST